MRALLVALTVFSVVSLSGMALAVTVGLSGNDSGLNATSLEGALVWTGHDLYRGYWVSFTLEAVVDHKVVWVSAESGAVAIGPYTVGLDIRKPLVGVEVWLVVEENGERVYEENLGWVFGGTTRFTVNGEAVLDCSGILHIRVYGGDGSLKYTGSTRAQEPVRILASQSHYTINDVRQVQQCSQPRSPTPSLWPTQPNVQPSDLPLKMVAVGAGAVGLGAAVAYALSRRG